MGGQGSGRPTSEDSILRRTMTPRLEFGNDGANGSNFVIPNLSGDLSAGTVQTSPTASNKPVNAGSVMGWVEHGAAAGTARPVGFGAVFWVGSVEPTNALNGDIWVDTT